MQSPNQIAQKQRDTKKRLQINFHFRGVLKNKIIFSISSQLVLKFIESIRRKGLYRSEEHRGDGNSRLYLRAINLSRRRFTAIVRNFDESLLATAFNLIMSNDVHWKHSRESSWLASQNAVREACVSSGTVSDNTSTRSYSVGYPKPMNESLAQLQL